MNIRKSKTWLETIFNEKSPNIKQIIKIIVRNPKMLPTHTHTFVSPVLNTQNLDDIIVSS